MLRGLVSDYVGYDFTGLPPGVHYGLPSTTLTLIITFGIPLLMSDRVNHDLQPYDVLIAGLHTTPAIIGHTGAMQGIQLDLTPFAARQLFAAPAAEVSEQSVHLDQLIGPLASELHERVSTCTTWAERFIAIDQILIAAFDHSYRPQPEIFEAWRLIGRRPIELEVGTLAAHLGWSTRYLSRRFREEFGIGPKSALRIARFNLARQLVSGGRPLAEVAASCGYADQSHLNRDFVQFAGHSPHRWLGEDVIVGG